MNEIKMYLKELPFWNDLKPSEMEACEKYAQIKTYQAGTVIHSIDQECLGFIKIISGDARTIMLSDEGREITLYKMNKNDTDVLSASCVVNQIRFETQIIADTGCKILIIPAVFLSYLKDNNIKVQCLVYKRLMERFSDVMTSLQKKLFTRIDSQIASLLINSTDNGQTLVINITHEEIAKQINTSREVVSRILEKMKTKGIIKLKRGQIEIIDYAKLNEYKI